MVDSTGQQDVKIKSVKSGLPEEPAPIAVYAATPFNANAPASSKQPITAPGAEEKTDFKYFQRQVSRSLTLCLSAASGHPRALPYVPCKSIMKHHLSNSEACDTRMNCCAIFCFGFHMESLRQLL